MSKEKKNDNAAWLFHIGPQKTATTWIYRCLKDHPGIIAPATDTIHYFDIHYHKGRAWYDAQFIPKAGTCYFDPTYTLIRSFVAPRRIARDFPDAKFIVTLRHPIERAFSHYWHERKKGRMRFSFTDALTHYDLFTDWIEPGLYARNLKPFIDLFGRQAVLAVKTADIAADPQAVLQSIYSHAGIDPGYVPPVMHRRINAAGPRTDIMHKTLYKAGDIITGNRAHESPFWRRLGGIETCKDGVDGNFYRELMAVFRPDIEETEKLLGLSLKEWQ